MNGDAPWMPCLVSGLDSGLLFDPACMFSLTRFPSLHLVYHFVYVLKYILTGFCLSSISRHRRTILPPRSKPSCKQRWPVHPGPKSMAKIRCFDACYGSGPVFAEKTRFQDTGRCFRENMPMILLISATVPSHVQEGAQKGRAAPETGAGGWAPPGLGIVRERSGPRSGICPPPDFPRPGCRADTPPNFALAA